jgi:hypothetical protein
MSVHILYCAYLCVLCHPGQKFVHSSPNTQGLCLYICLYIYIYIVVAMLIGFNV